MTEMSQRLVVAIYLMRINYSLGPREKQVELLGQDTTGRICRLAVNWQDYQSRFRQEAVDAHRTTYSGPFGRGQRDSLAAKVGRFASALEP
jgi:hypothetical protein